MKLWLDDVRKPPDESWVWAKTSQEAISYLRYSKEPVTEISLDHDLGLYDTGVPVAKYITEMVPLPGDSVAIRIHSMNPVGAQRLRRVLESAGFAIRSDAYERVRREGIVDAAASTEPHED